LDTIYTLYGQQKYMYDNHPQCEPPFCSSGASLQGLAQRRNGFGNGITQPAFWQTSFTETGIISAIARSTASGFPVRRWDGLRRVRAGTRLRIIRRNANV